MPVTVQSFVQLTYGDWPSVVFLFVLLFAVPLACGSSEARDQTCIAVATCTTAMAMLDP